jgi:hypothetical protein
MWLRDHIAMKVFDYLMRLPASSFDNPTAGGLCDTAYRWADAMLKAREAD